MYAFQICGYTITIVNWPTLNSQREMLVMLINRLPVPLSVGSIAGAKNGDYF
jgi:hypothetical protein